MSFYELLKKFKNFHKISNLDLKITNLILKYDSNDFCNHLDHFPRFDLIEKLNDLRELSEKFQKNEVGFL